MNFNDDSCLSARVTNMNRGVWQYIQIQSAKDKVPVPVFIEKLVKLHAQINNKTSILKTLIEEFANETESDSINVKADIIDKLKQL